MNRSVNSVSRSAGIADHPVAVADSSGDVWVSGVLVRMLADTLQQRGIAPEILLAQRGSDATRPERLDAGLSLAEYQVLFQRALRLTAEPALGLHCGLYATEASFDLMGPLVSHAQTLRHAIQLGRQFARLLMDDVRLHFHEQAGSAKLRCEFPRVDRTFDRSFAEFVLAGLLRLLRVFGGARVELSAVRFEHARPAYHHEYAIAFGGAERFAQDFTGLEFDSRLLDRPHLHRQPELHALLRAGAERSLERLSRPKTFVERVQAFVRTQPVASALDMNLAARELGLSIRSLRRRLADEGTSYRALTQAALQESALAMLRDPERTVQATADALGFADATAFHRAFRRWTGVTPAQYRESNGLR
jgi:AraC-like DNA-binding protein